MTGATTTNDHALTLTCVECGEPYARTAAEQRYYDQRAAQPPETCPSCRARLRTARNEAMRAAHANGAREAIGQQVPQRSFGDRVRQGGSRRVGRSGDEPQLFHAVCADCGRPTEVPFRPRSGRPVFCRDCYNARRGR